MLRAVTVPVEHGGWGLTTEPVVLGLMVAPSVAGACIGAAAVVAFLARTPLKVVLVDSRRNRTLHRTRVARSVFAAELAVIVALITVAAARATPGGWWPLLLVAPLVSVELWFDMRSRSRRLIPELSGAVGIGGVAALIMLAGSEAGALAGAAWMILAGRAITAIVTVRDQVGRLHGRSGHPHHIAWADAASVAIVVAAVAWDPKVLAGAVAVLVAIAVQRALARKPIPRPVVLGLRQTAIGMAVVVAIAAGILIS